MPDKNEQDIPMQWHPVPAVLAWVVPGLGHLVIGERARGVILMVCLYSLFGAGLLIGGIDVVDADRDPLWFAGQSLLGPVTILIDLQHAALDRQLGRQIKEAGQLEALLAADSPAPAYRASIGRVNELGTLYCTLAGLLNLLVILDVAYRAQPASVASASGRPSESEHAADGAGAAEPEER